MTKLIPLNIPLASDADDVIFNYVMGGYGKYVEKQTGNVLSPDGPDGWDMSSWTGVPYDETIRLIKEFNASEDFGKLPLFDCAKDIFPKISKSGRPMHIVTSCAEEIEVHVRRKANLTHPLGDIFQSIVCLDLGVSKVQALEEIAALHGTPGIWAEDNFKNGKAGADLGYTTFMFRRNHNRVFEVAENAHPNITWVDSWHDVAPYLLPDAA
jgi:hypothetical protein